MAWAHSVAVTIDHTKCGAADATNHPVLFSGVYSELRSTASGGSVINAPYDVIFASDSAGASPLSFQRVGYNSGTGAILCYVLLPTVSHTTDTVFYILFGNAAVTTDQQSAAAVWVNSYATVQPLFANSSDSLGVNNGTDTSVTYGAAGPVASELGATFTGSSNVQLASSASLNISGSITMETWVYPTGSADYQALIVKSTSSSVRQYAMFLVVGNTSQLYISMGGSPDVGAVTLSSPWVINAWNHIAVTADGTNIKVYLNGALVNTTASARVAITAANPVYIGYEGALPGLGVIGRMFGSRISTVARTGAWFTLQYNNHVSPSTFYSSSLTTNNQYLGTAYSPLFVIGSKIIRIGGAGAGALHQAVLSPVDIQSTPPPYVNPGMNGGMNG